MLCYHSLSSQIGGATGLVGDPSGRSSERNRLTHDSLQFNLEGIKNDLMRVFNNAKQYLPDHVDNRELMLVALLPCIV